MNPPFQFRLRTLFAFVAVAAVACGLAAHAGTGGFVLLACSSIGLLLGIAGLAATEAVRKRVRPRWIWVPLLMGVVSGTMAVWGLLFFLLVVLLAVAKLLFPVLVD